MTAHAAIAAALLFVAAPAAAMQGEAASEAAPTASFAAWHGVWVGEGTALGRPATATLRLGPALGGDALLLDYELTVTGAPKPFFGHAIYRVDDRRRITGQWSDSQGALHLVKGQLDVAMWSTHWGSPLTEIGRSTYALEGDKALRVTDSVMQADGSWRVFATMTYARETR